MIEKTFRMWGKSVRPTTIKIDDDYIVFSFKEEGNREFYSIPKDEWISDFKKTRQGREDNWHSHMKEKIWFSNPMYAFIQKACNLVNA